MRAARRPTLLLLLAFVLAFVPRAGALAQPAATPLPEPALAAIFRELAALKGITSPGPPPPLAIRSREETRRFMEQELARRYSPARLEAERKAMVAWGLIPADYLVVLESERVAESVCRSIASVVDRRHPSLAGRGVRGPAGNIVIWQDGPRAFLVERRGAEVLLLESVPAGTADRLRDRVWRAHSVNP